MSSGRIAVLISGSGSNLQALIDASRRGDMAGDIALVISNKAEAYGLQRANKAGIDTVVIDHREFECREVYDQAIAAELNKVQPNLIVLAGYMRILSHEFVEKYRGRLINVHPSLLPKYPGLHTHKRAIEAGDSDHGATVHFVTEELDGGPPIVQGRISISNSDEAELASRVQQEIEHRIYPLAVDWFLNGRLQFSDNHAYLDRELIPPSGIQWTNNT
jgi:phosphoribosylglycinamide formyltransferase-1